MATSGISRRGATVGRAAFALLCGLVVAALAAGCLRLDIAVTLLEDDTATAAMEMAMQDSAVSALGFDPAELWSEAEADLLAELPSGSQAELFSADGWSGARIDIPASPIGQLSGFADMGVEDITIARDGHFFVFEAYAGMSDEMAELADEMPPGAGPLSLTFRLTCPGAIIETNGVAAGNRVQWDLTEYGSAEPLTARCGAVYDAGATAAYVDSSTTTTSEREAYPTGLARWWPLLVAGLAVLAALGLLAYFLRKRSHAEEAADPAHFDTMSNWATGQQPVVGSAPIYPPSAPVAAVPDADADLDARTDAFGAPAQWEADDLGENEGR